MACARRNVRSWSDFLAAVTLNIVIWCDVVRSSLEPIYRRFEGTYVALQERQWTCNVKLRRIRVTTVAVESSKQYTFCICVCSLSYPACKSHAPFFHLWPVRLYWIFFALCHKRHYFREKIIDHKMCVLIFCTTFVCNISHSKKNWARCDQKRILVFMYSTLKLLLSDF
jgi:hypothetical protein